MVCKVLGIVVFCEWTPNAAAQTPTTNNNRIEIKLAELEEGNPLVEYRKALIKLAMEASGKEYSLTKCDVSSGSTSDFRYAELIKEGVRCNMLATSAGGDATGKLMIIPFPIYLGGGGYRVLLANARSIKGSESIKSLADLRKYKVGSGLGWVDTKIMSENGFDVVKSNYYNLFDMLRVGRFEYLTRSIYEASSELALNGRDGELIIVPNILLHYPVDLFFYVTPGREDIKNSMLDGLVKLYNSGLYEKFLSEHESTKNSLLVVKPETRIILEIENRRLTFEERSALEKFKSKWIRELNPH
ncbi:MAG: hypothetical protein RR736_07300 [Pseudomonas sp.]|uniref:hypothetical protein n=1 Tax=Pseudomonas sp. TaxID=306 RepID=UPI002FCA026B